MIASSSEVASVLMKLPYRRTVRIQNFVYRGATYFVTVNAFKNRCMFGDPEDLRLSAVGLVVEEEWQRTPIVRPGVDLDDFVIMPNHLHALVYIPETPPSETPANPRAVSLASLIGGFKSAVTSRTRDELQFATRVWQRNYYEHIIRGQRGLESARERIAENSRRWLDRRHGLLSR